ncbi:hypothetical protein C8J57DRAFT_1470649 [Mycena rebaudengoi]|nr:hypothetical protein C8J57DRAFT_1470649 [Mycena rebaudengoi]
MSGTYGDVELDGLDIPAVALPRRAKTYDTTKYKKRKMTKATTTAAAPPREWWEEWEDEKLAGRTYNPNSAPVERFHQAAADFQRLRTFPASLQELWDHFRRFAGVLESVKATYAEEHENTSKFLLGKEQSRLPKPKTEDVQKIAEISPLKKENNAGIFLRDPELAVRVFLSSYMKAKGLIWKERFLVYAPHLLRFFVTYLLQNSVLPDHSRSLNTAMEVIDYAAKELLCTVKISAALPDGFAVACRSQWGRRADGCVVVDEDDAEPDAKRVKLDVESEPPAADADMSSTWGSGGWGSGQWGAQSPDTIFPAYPATTNLPSDESPANTPTKLDSWAPTGIPSLLSLFGPTALPLTHVPGLVEWSVRRIASIIAPEAICSHDENCECCEATMDPDSSPVPDPDCDVPSTPAPDAVERSITRHMAHVEMVPWPAWDGDAEAGQPRLLRGARGEVVGDTVDDAGVYEGADGGVEHDVLVDNITLLLDPAAAETLCVGMGLGGTWVQLAQVGGETKLKKEKSKGTVQKTRYWYLEEFVVVLPSYWTA